MLFDGSYLFVCSIYYVLHKNKIVINLGKPKKKEIEEKDLFTGQVIF